jgi:hypothetical protein
LLKIPNDGVLAIKGYGPFDSYLCTAKFANGDAIWVSKQINDKRPNGTIALFGGYTILRVDSDGKGASDYRWFVGTEKEWKASRE